MNKQTIIDLLIGNYSSFVNYLNSLTNEEYLFHNGEKWNAGQQLEHIVRCATPLVKVFSMDKSAIAAAFGQTERQSRTYEILLSDYMLKLHDGGKAPSRFVPQEVAPNQREDSCKILTAQVHELCSKVNAFNEQELDSLLIPHPLLGNLTLREMLYNTAYHVKHHQAQIQDNLKKMISPKA